MLFVSRLHSGGWLTTEGENGLARLLLHRNFLFHRELFIHLKSYLSSILFAIGRRVKQVQITSNTQLKVALTLKKSLTTLYGSSLVDPYKKEKGD